MSVKQKIEPNSHKLSIFVKNRKIAECFILCHVGSLGRRYQTVIHYNPMTPFFEISACTTGALF